MGVKCLVNTVKKLHVDNIGKVVHAEEHLCPLDSFLGQLDGFQLFVLLIIFWPQQLDKAVGQTVELALGAARPRDNKGRPGLVDEHAVHLVDDGIMEAPLNLAVEAECHVVPQIVKAELIVCSVDHISRIGGFLFLRRLPADDKADPQAQKLVDLPHELPVPPGQIIVDGHHENALALQGIEVGGQGRHQGFALTGFHLGNIALVQDEPADELNRKRLQADGPVRRLPDHRKGLGGQIIQRLSVLKPFPEQRGLISEGAVAERGHCVLQGQDPVRCFLKPFYITPGWVENLI